MSQAKSKADSDMLEEYDFSGGVRGKYAKHYAEGTAGGEERRSAQTPEPASPSPDPVDEAAEESFPASDPPSWAPLHSGSPGKHPDAPGNDPQSRPQKDAPE
jgi:hypothetical protein